MGPRVRASGPLWPTCRHGSQRRRLGRGSAREPGRMLSLSGCLLDLLLLLLLLALPLPLLQLELELQLLLLMFAFLLRQQVQPQEVMVTLPTTVAMATASAMARASVTAVLVTAAGVMIDSPSLVFFQVSEMLPLAKTS